jgi:hypothetical protein
VRLRSRNSPLKVRKPPCPSSRPTVPPTCTTSPSRWSRPFSLLKTCPKVVPSVCCAPLLSTMLTTPAMASEPYCAAAPSRSTSIRSIALAGIAFRSTEVEPRPTVPLTWTSAVL